MSKINKEVPVISLFVFWLAFVIMIAMIALSIFMGFEAFNKNDLDVTLLLVSIGNFSFFLFILYSIIHWSLTRLTSDGVIKIKLFTKGGIRQVRTIRWSDVCSVKHRNYVYTFISADDSLSINVALYPSIFKVNKFLDDNVPRHVSRSGD